MAVRELIGQDKSEFNVIFVPRHLDDAGLSAIEFRIYAHLARRANKTGRAWPGIDSIAKTCGVTQRTVIRAIESLEKQNLIEVRRQTGKGNFYVLTKPSSWDIPNLQTDRCRSVTGDTDGQKPVTPGQRKGIQEGYPIPADRGSDVIHKEQSHTDFIKLWSESYREHFGCEYAFQSGKDAKAVKHLLLSSKLPPTELIVIAQAAWKNGAGFYCKSAASITGFNSKFNEIRQELKNGTHKKPTSGVSRSVGTANEGKHTQYRGVGRVR